MLETLCSVVEAANQLIDLLPQATGFALVSLVGERG
jgi:hypothetical protein